MVNEKDKDTGSVQGTLGLDEDSSDVVEEEIVDEELEEGVDPSMLYADTREHQLEVRAMGKKWTFYYRDMTWGEKNECIDAAQVWESGEFKFSISAYYALALQKMLTRSPIRPISETTLKKLHRSVGDALTSIVPTPVEQDEVEAIKKV